MRKAVTSKRSLFAATIFVGSFLLFLMQPMVARMALPELGGAPAVWNSAMLVYQALLLGGYAYAHWLGRFAMARQAVLHIGLLLFAALWLPISLVNMASWAEGLEVFWVPTLLAASIGPLFFAVAAQAPLIQRWFALDDRETSQPWALYAASNLGSFGGLLTYPLLMEPNLSLTTQRWSWSLGYALLILLVIYVAWTRRSIPAMKQVSKAQSAPVPPRRTLMWLALSAVPSGLILSTTIHLTTDIFAMPLLWVIPLGLYLLSFTVAFADGRSVAKWITRHAPATLLMIGGTAALGNTSIPLVAMTVNLLLLFVISVALHSRLYDLRPEPDRLTQFYLMMSLGGVLGGLFAAIVAPLVFDWVYEHPILLLAAAALLPLRSIFPSLQLTKNGKLALLLIAALSTLFFISDWFADMLILRVILQTIALVSIFMVGLALTTDRRFFVVVLVLAMLALGGAETINTSLTGKRIRSYFGVYAIKDYSDRVTLAHGTTLHGSQYKSADQELDPTSYYGRESGGGLAMLKAPEIFGPNTSIAMVGLGTGTMACYKQPSQRWQFFEIDPAIVRIAKNSGSFTFIPKCAPDAVITVGDARLELDKIAKIAPASFDILVIDAFSSDTIPLHLLTYEALEVYSHTLAFDGLLLIHISNRHVDLAPVLAAEAKAHGWAAALRHNVPVKKKDSFLLASSNWVAMARNPALLERLTGKMGDERNPSEVEWKPLIVDPSVPVWRDDYASILPVMDWSGMIGKIK